MIKLFVGFDQREAAAYHVFCQSVIDHSSVPVSFIPIHKGMLKGFDGQRDGSNAFIFSRYLVPSLCNFTGWAAFADGDMVCNVDIADLWEYRDESSAAIVVKHDYQTKHHRKYMGSVLESPNMDYPRKNWSSLILWNCSHPANKVLTAGYLADKSPQFIHRFSWLKDHEIGALPADWNYLVGEYPPGPANLFHYTLGVSGIKHYADETASWKWHEALVNALECAGENPTAMVKRSEERVRAIL